MPLNRLHVRYLAARLVGFEVLAQV